MSEIVVPMAAQRDIRTVTTEIRTLTQQAQRLILEYAIEVGRRLREAKSMLPHGDWGRWLREEVEFSQSTAENFMRIFDEYGDEQISIFGATAKSQTLGNLPYTKALKLLALPAEEREAFVKENDVEGMSTRELDKAIKERDAAKGETVAVKNALRKAEGERDDLRKQLQEVQDSVKREAEEQERQLREALEKALQDADSARQEAQEALRQAEEQKEIPKEVLEKLEQEAAEKAAEAQKAEREKLLQKAEKLKAKEAEAKEAVLRLEQEAEELRKRLQKADPAVAKFGYIFGVVQENFETMMGLIGQMDAQTAVKLRSAVKAVLVKFDAQLEK